MRVIIAARLSQLAPGQTGLDSQDRLARAYADRMGYEVVAMLADRKSGTSAPWERKNLKPWVTAPDKIAQYDAVLAYRLDRLSRGDDESTSAIEDWARTHGKQLLTEDGLVYPCEGNDGIRWDITKRIAHEEWLGYSEKYRRMQSELRAKGCHVGKAPYGFMIIGPRGAKTLVPDDETADVVRELFRRYDDGDTLATIGADFNARGLLANPCPDGCEKEHKHTAGYLWTAKTLAQVLRNPVIAGRYTHGGETVRVPPIIGITKWQRIQRIMDSRANRKGIAPGEPALLTSVALCELCECPMYRTPSTGRKRKDGTRPDTLVYYRCHGDGYTASKCRNSVQVAKLDVMVSDAIAELGTGRYRETYVIPGYNHDDEIAQIRLDIGALDIFAADYDERREALLAEAVRLKGLPAVPDEIKTRETDETIGQRWARLSPADRRAALLAAGARVYVDATGKGEPRVRLVNVVPATLGLAA